MTKILSVAEKNALRRKNCVKWNKERRHRFKKEHRCIWCGSKCKPKIKYSQFCEKHIERIKENKQKNIQRSYFVIKNKCKEETKCLIN